MKRLIDVSQPLGPATAVWPGDRPVRIDWTLRRDRGDAVDVASLSTSVHAGTHVDGPAHTGAGPGAGSLGLDAFYGPCLVVDARGRIDGDPPRVGPAALEGIGAASRILFRTRDRVDPGTFPGTFAALAPELCRRLAAAGVVLVGTDAPSVDPVDSKMLESHRALAEAGIVNVENLDLSGVEAGQYVLAAFPLRLEESDSAPVRAVLIAEE